MARYEAGIMILIFKQEQKAEDSYVDKDRLGSMAAG